MHEVAFSSQIFVVVVAAAAGCGYSTVCIGIFETIVSCFVAQMSRHERMDGMVHTNVLLSLELDENLNRSVQTINVNGVYDKCFHSY